MPKNVMPVLLLLPDFFYAQLWKLTLMPSEEILQQKLKDCIEMYRLTLVLNQKLDEIFKAKWCEV